MLGGNEVVTQRGSSINLSGGALDVQTGYAYQTWLRGADGRLYSLDEASANMRFAGVYNGFELCEAAAVPRADTTPASASRSPASCCGVISKRRVR